MRAISTAGPARPARLGRIVGLGRMLGALLLLLALVVPELALGALGLASLEAGAHAQGSETSSRSRGSFADEGGSCGDDSLPGKDGEELFDCGSQLEARLGEPLVIALLRSTEVRTTKQKCEELLADIWSEQSCSADGRDCGKLVPGAPVGPGPELVSSSSSAHSSFASLGFGAASSRRLALPTDDRLPKPRDLQPPVPPPKLPVH